MYVITSYLVLHPLFSGAALLGGIPCALLYSCTFFHKRCTNLFPCCTFCGLATCAASSSPLLCFSTSTFRHSYLKCPTSQYLKHLTPSSTSCHLTFTSPFIPHCITLLANTSNLFWGIGFLFSSLFLFL